MSLASRTLVIGTLLPWTIPVATIVVGGTHALLSWTDWSVGLAVTVTLAVNATLFCLIVTGHRREVRRFHSDRHTDASTSPARTLFLWTVLLWLFQDGYGVVVIALALTEAWWTMALTCYGAVMLQFLCAAVSIGAGIISDVRDNLQRRTTPPDDE
ncbi:hypothetical protein [Haloglycomyces albus]|uniref:hypothetical protein n=1 Tax=Haloglycomyces albus TaxID=526067 RepID=UPI00046D8B3E|nr:hypothetical protein [Haloglycomyces albus]